MNKRFWSKVDIRGIDECWPWTAGRYANGYGAFQSALKADGRKQTGAHRYAYELEHGAIPEGMLVCHSCDNPGCCNPAHLFLGTDRTNAVDKIRKGRHNSPRGSSNHLAKLTEDQVIGVMARLLTGRETRAQIAHSLGVSWHTIQQIWTGRSWSHLFDPSIT